MTLDPEHLTGRPIGPFVLDRLIGQGGFAWVFSGHRTEGGDAVAVKVLKPRYAGDKAFESRFRNEAEVAGELRHPNVVRLLGVGQDQDITYFAMDLYPDSLASLLERRGPLPESVVLRIATDIAAALAFAHAKGVVHRDIKVDNILLRSDGGAVVADFGIARAVSGYVSATGVNMTIGTPHYVSPEQAQGRPLDGRSDLYAFGVTLYKATTGELPFRSTDWFELARMHVEDPPRPPRKIRPELSPRLERIILRCLAKHPDDRYPSAATLVNELAQIPDPGRSTDSFGPAGRSTAESGRDDRGTRRRWLLLPVAIVIVALVAMVVVMLGRR